MEKSWEVLDVVGYQETSGIAYEEIKSDGTVGKRQKQVLECLNLGNKTNSEISRETALPINCVTPRTKELRAFGLVEEKGRKRDTITKKLSIIWGLRR